jgi:hypothetical protein
MSKRPEEIRIDDLADPVLSPDQRAALEGASRIGVSFDLEGILEAARQQTGLSDFGADDFRERRALWLEAA